MIHSKRDFFKSFPRGGLAVEVGVLHGTTSQMILDCIHPDRLVLIDEWRECHNLTTGEDLDAEAVYQGCVDRFKDKPHVEIWRGLSLHKIPELEKASVSFAYIDACHRYEACLADLEAMFTKMTPGGWLCGHDYCEIDAYGVVRAVAVFLDRHGLTLDRLTDYPLGKRHGSSRKYYSRETAYNAYGIQIPK